MLMPSVRALDFGRAFYLTSDFEQASRWARTAVLRRGDGSAVVSVYEFDEAAASVLKSDAALACLTFLEGRIV